MEPAKVELVTHGRAAKVIAIYLKAMVITNGHHGSMLARVAHPPIDRILLRALAERERADTEARARWNTINWTQLDEPQYEAMIRQLRGLAGPDAPFWTLEECWSPVEET